MQTYDAFLKDSFHFQPRPFIKFFSRNPDGTRGVAVDVTDRLIEDHSVISNALLDTPTLNVWTTSRVVFCLDNSDNLLNTKSDPNLFTEMGRAVSGWQTPVEISVLFEGDPQAPTTAEIMFVGYIEQVTEVMDRRWVRVLLLDYSGLLQSYVVEDFGREVKAILQGADDAPDYTDVNPVYNLPAYSAPVSRNSLSVEIGGSELTVLPTLPRGGPFLTSRHVAVNEDTGELSFGAKLERGSATTVSVAFKSAFRYRTPEALVYALLDASGIYSEYSDAEKHFAREFLGDPDQPLASRSTELTYTRPEVSSHGRPSVGQASPVIRWITSNLLPSGSREFYMGGSRKMFRYQRRNTSLGDLDRWSEVSEAPSGESILQFVRHSDGTFYVLTVSNWTGDPARIYNVSGTTWTLIANTNATATHFYDFSQQFDPTADNRKSFLIHLGYLYYIFRNSSHFGIKRIQLSDDTVSTVFQQPATGNVASSAKWSMDFAIDPYGIYLYALWCQRPDRATNHLRVYRMGLDGSGEEEIYSKDYPDSLRYEPAMVSDVVTRSVFGSNPSRTALYFVLTYARAQGAGRTGFSELCELSNVNQVGMRTDSDLEVKKKYEDALYSARSLVVHGVGQDRTVYFLEGTWLSAIKKFPNSDESGHLGSIDFQGTYTDLGPAWQSYRDTSGSGVGLHTAFASNLHSADALHFISGYGMLADTEGSDRNNWRVSSNLGFITQSIDNWVWLQYGEKLATKISVFPTNDRTVWSLLEELARVLDYEIGWTSGQEEMVAFNKRYENANPPVKVLPKGYLFFRPRRGGIAQGGTDTSLVIDESDLIGLSSSLDTTLIFNHVSMPFGTGVKIAKVDDARVRNLSLVNRLLSDSDSPWADLIAEQVLERQRIPRLKTEIPMKFAPQLALGDRIRVTNEYHSLSETPFRITEIEHNFNIWQTRLEMREDVDPLYLPLLGDLTYKVGESVSGMLPVAVGGTGAKTYELENAPAWLTFDVSSRTYSGTAAVANVILTYKVTDTSGTYSRSFRLKVVAETLSFGGTTISDKVLRTYCYVEIELPAATGVDQVDLYYTVSGLPDGLEFYSDTRKIVGVSTTEGVSSITYTAQVYRGNAASVSLMFSIRREDVGKVSGLYFISNRVGVLNDGANELREYNYSSKLRDTTNDLDLGVGTWTGCCAVASHRIFVDNDGNRGVFYSGNTLSGEVALGAGDWRDVCEHPTASGVVLFYDAATRYFRAYTTARVQSQLNDIQLADFVDIHSVVKNGNKLLCVVKNSPVLVTVDQMGVILTTASDFVSVSQGYIGIAWTGSNYLLVWSGSVEANAFSPAGVRSENNDLKLWS